MPTRAEIFHALTTEHEHFLADFQTLTPEELECPCTKSEVQDAAPWTPKDHLAHLVMIERTFQRIVKNALNGDEDPVGFKRMGLKNKDEIRQRVNLNNQKYTVAHHDDSLEKVYSDLAATRQETLALLEQLTDEQLTHPLPGSPWADGTIGGILITNAGHERMHKKWIDEGLQQHHLDAVNPS